MLGAFTHIRIILTLSFMVPQVIGVILESMKFDDYQKKRPNHDKYFFVRVHCLEMWQH
jgi:hypothetical protein